MKAADIMTSDPCCCSPDDSLRAVAQAMRDHDCGAVPVVNNGRLVGMVTDRDLAVRGLASGMSADDKIADIITNDPCCCSETDDVRDVETVMAEHQIRRVPIVDSEGCCVGIVSQADLARAASDGQNVSEHEVAIILEQLSAPAQSMNRSRVGAPQLPS